MDAQRSKWIAWAVHLLTASGAAIALFALIATATGRMAIAVELMLVALVIDAVDGTFARAVRVTEYAPEIDGRRLDDIVDYLNYVIVPVFFVWAGGFVAHPAWLAAPVLASAFGFARVDAKTEDDFFLGFPSYWNILAIYLWLFDVGPIASTAWLAGLSLAVFVPLKYLYPSKSSRGRCGVRSAWAAWSGARRWPPARPRPTGPAASGSARPPSPIRSGTSCYR